MSASASKTHLPQEISGLNVTPNNRTKRISWNEGKWAKKKTKLCAHKLQVHYIITYLLYLLYTRTHINHMREKNENVWHVIHKILHKSDSAKSQCRSALSCIQIWLHKILARIYCACMTVQLFNRVTDRPARLPACMCECVLFLDIEN